MQFINKCKIPTIINYLILLVSINLWSFNTLPNDVENTKLFTESTEIAVTVSNTNNHQESRRLIFACTEDRYSFLD